MVSRSLNTVSRDFTLPIHFGGVRFASRLPMHSTAISRLYIGTWSTRTCFLAHSRSSKRSHTHLVALLRFIRQRYSNSRLIGPALGRPVKSSAFWGHPCCFDRKRGCTSRQIVSTFCRTTRVRSSRRDSV